MKLIHRIFLPALLCVAHMTAAQVQMPAGFHWVDFRKEAAIVSSVASALKAENYTAIREIGVLNDFALVMIIHRETEQPTPQGDEWQVYNVSTKDWTAQKLITGYNLEIRDWIKFQSNGPPDLAVMYLDCWECEPASIFTALHFDPQKGWRARWNNDKSAAQPGVTTGVTDVGDPYTNEDVDQVFAVLAPPKGIASVGTWYHSKDLGTGKVTDIVSKYFVNDGNGEDKSVNLTGSQATDWNLRLCKPGSPPFGLSAGQSSRACRALINAKNSR